MSEPIYLDYAATTPVHESVAEKMASCMTFQGAFGNPASRSHKFGWQAEELVDEARHQIAELINADPREIVFTSGATESDNLAIKGVAHAHQEHGRHIITVATEHKAVLDTCAALESEGFDVTYLQVSKSGEIDPDALKNAIREDTILVSVMHVNNEIGVIQNIKGISDICHGANVLLHVDGAQSVGKIPVDVEALGIDLMSISAHKMYGPKGIGALYVRRAPKVQIEAQIHGGGHERGMRSGTLATHQIVGFGAAAELALQDLEQTRTHLRSLRDKLAQGLQKMDGVIINGEAAERVDGILNVSFADVPGDALLMQLNGLAVSSGSACNSATVEPSFVLQALGIERELALSSLRFSVGRYTTEQDIEETIKRVTETITRLRETGNFWPT
ncbi:MULTISPECIES: IscS subfamily cysteine desulfurase [Gammaproteobacteria]|uniref:IscS subfamily cysteine desulfurase n=1 Tax=Gammaproteobacteria TaxID=1236 RepID=UPI000DD0C950|nr:MULTISPECIES: IscS subfamily cysteine desulfurase [Gammaproteobacteria]RTE86217.1 IscS subfamily cysteine desulfurase [Aliidiomarina sp. B3213]TCZ91568.1 IscS subfamily cysteine desulfurase [Lysobacter sp. N42]